MARWWAVSRSHRGQYIATMVVFYQLLHQAFPTVDYKSDPLDVVRREYLLRKFVNFVSSEHTFCAPTAWFQITDNPGQHGRPTKEISSTFRPTFEELFSQNQLTLGYLSDVHKAIRLVRMVHQLPRNSVGNVSDSLRQLIDSFLRADQPVHFSETIAWLPAVNRTNLYSSNSSLIGIAVCHKQHLKDYISLTGEIRPPITKDFCSDFPDQIPVSESTQPNQPLDQHSQFFFRWRTGDCTRAPQPTPHVPIWFSILPVVPVKDYPRFFFELDFRTFTLDQCAADAHRCGATTKCVYHQYSPWPFAMDNYICKCASSFYLDNADNGYPAPFIHAQLRTSSGDSLPQFLCQTCPLGCSRCGMDRTCRASLDLNLLRAIPLAVQSFCSTICVILGLALFRLRRSRVIRAANWVLMEILLLGALLLYLIVVLMYFPPGDLTCLILPWLRELGFSIMYGVLIVKIYRVLSSFQSRKAHRVHIRDKDILKFLGIFIVSTFTYMVAWTAVNLDYISAAPWNHLEAGETPVSIVQHGEIVVPRSISETDHRISNKTPQINHTGHGLNTEATGTQTITFDVCRSMSWDIVVELDLFRWLN